MQLNFKINHHIYLKDPESSVLGKQIVATSIDLFFELGFEAFTFKKLAQKMETTEATIYRYFENKHRILLYVLNWYWNYLDFLVKINLQNIADPKQKLSVIIDLITNELPDYLQTEYQSNKLYAIVVAESSKVYLTKEIELINKHEVFKPYKDLCAAIAIFINEYKASYLYPKSLASTIVETAHNQQFFSENLPKLTDKSIVVEKHYAKVFLKDLVFKVLA